MHCTNHSHTCQFLVLFGQSAANWTFELQVAEVTIKHIPNYGLYGEPHDSAAAIGIHIEEIVERSRGQNWIIKPHRHGKLFQILCIFDDEATIQLDERHYQIEGWSLVTIPIGVVHGFSFRPDSEGVVITLSEETLTTILNLQGPEYLRPVFEEATVIVE